MLNYHIHSQPKEEILSMQLDFGLKHTEPFDRVIDITGPTSVLTDDANTRPEHPNDDVTIWDGSLFEFGADYNTIMGTDSVRKLNEFKKLHGAVGLVLDESELPIEDTTVEFYKGNVKLGSIKTDENGYFYIDYKHTGKATPFTIKVPEYTLVYTEEMKANKFILHIFTVP